MSTPVESAVRATGEKIPNNPGPRIETYLDRIEEALSHTAEDERSRNKRLTFFEFLRSGLIENYIIKLEDIPKAYWTAQQRQAREEGHGDVEVTEIARQQGAEMIRKDQIYSLDLWLTYLTSEENNYDNWFRYWSFRSVLNLSTFDKEKGEFSKRAKGTVAPFPEINSEALGFVYQQVKSYYQRRGNIPQDEQSSQETQGGGQRREVWEDNEQLRKLLENPNFGKLYAFALNYVTPIEQMEKENTRGVWVTYPKGSDPQELFSRIEGRGTGWCISTGYDTLSKYLEIGDFHIYYSYDSQGNPTNPRIAVRMDQNGQVAEVRGIGPRQEMESNMLEIANKKTNELPGGEEYKKKYSDMKMLTAIDGKVNKGEELTIEELAFLYEIDSQIVGFGWKRDPRIAEIISIRDPLADYLKLRDRVDDIPKNMLDQIYFLLAERPYSYNKRFHDTFWILVEDICTHKTSTEYKTSILQLLIKMTTDEDFDKESHKKAWDILDRFGDQNTADTIAEYMYLGTIDYYNEERFGVDDFERYFAYVENKGGIRSANRLADCTLRMNFPYDYRKRAYTFISVNGNDETAEVLIKGLIDINVSDTERNEVKLTIEKIKSKKQQ